MLAVDRVSMLGCTTSEAERITMKLPQQFVVTVLRIGEMLQTLAERSRSRSSTLAVNFHPIPRICILCGRVSPPGTLRDLAGVPPRGAYCPQVLKRGTSSRMLSGISSDPVTRICVDGWTTSLSFDRPASCTWASRCAGGSLPFSATCAVVVLLSVSVAAAREISRAHQRCPLLPPCRSSCPQAALSTVQAA